MTDKQLERVRERWDGIEEAALIRIKHLVASYAVEYAGGHGMVTRKVTGLAMRINEELGRATSAARYAGQAYGVLTGEEPPRS